GRALAAAPLRSGETAAQADHRPPGGVGAPARSAAAPAQGVATAFRRAAADGAHDEARAGAEEAGALAARADGACAGFGGVSCHAGVARATRSRAGGLRF